MYIIENLSKVIKNKKREFKLLENLNFDLPDCGLIFIIGKSGSGKTTLINILEGIDTQYSGSIYFNGTKLSKNSSKISKYIKNSVSILFQNNNLNLEDSVFDNCIDALLISGSNKKTEKADLEDNFKKFNLLSQKTKNCLNISGGESQRVSLIRALSKPFETLFCDEPTGSLDETNSISVFEELKHISKTKLVVVVSHNIKLVAQYADGVIELRDGKIVNIDVPNLENNNVHEEINKSLKFLPFLNKDFKRNLKSYILITFCLIFSFILLFSTLSIYSISSNLLYIVPYTFKDNNVSLISNETLVSSYNGIDRYSLSRPSLFDIENAMILKGCIIDVNFDYIFSNYLNMNIDNYETVSFVPYDSKNNKFYINEAFRNVYSSDNLELAFNIKTENIIDSEIINDEINFNINIQLNLYKEFLILATPRIYYPYSLIKNIFQNKILENYSKKKEFDISLYQYLWECDNNDPITSYSLICFSNNIEKQKELDQYNDKNINKTALKINNNNYKTIKVICEALDSFILYFLLLIGLSFIGLFLIISFKTFESIQKEKKRIAIYRFLGMSPAEYGNIKIINLFMIYVFSVISSLGISSVLLKATDKLLIKYLYLNINLGLNSPFMDNFSFYSLLGIALFVLIFLIIKIPLVNIRRLDIKKELNSL